MIFNKELILRCLNEIEAKGRKLDYLLIKNLFDCQNMEIIEELKRYQNPDGGFGGGLEPDVRLPESSVVCTDEAVEILKEVDDALKQQLLEDIVKYYESSYIPDWEEWELVPPAVDQYPRAVWWNYSGVAEFSFGNPNPQIIGFLYRHRDFVTKLDVDVLVDKVMTYLQNTFLEEARKHNIMSSLMFYCYMDEDRKKLIFPILKEAVDKEIAQDNWEEYCLQPYEVMMICADFLVGHEELLERNLEYQYQKLQNGLIMPNWEWHQFEEEFEKAKWEWAGYLTFFVIKALLS